MINWKNTTENLGLTLISVLIGVFIGYYISIISTERLIEQLKPTIEKAIDKETIKNEIKNEIDLTIDKIKKSDSLNININQVPVNNQKPKNIIVTKKDSTPVKKKGFFKRLFSKNQNN